ncbi:MAG TPA: FtsX-like permease family protein, partial [Thermoanaerobaculia bacterium]|nr:FtsX-like permease family protein [Thermoanaerobaculia bacterium]
MSILSRSSRRHLLDHPLQLALAVAGVALGVAVVVSIDLANASAARAFDLSAETVAGRATHRVAGGPAGLPEEVFRRLVVEAGVAPAAPVVEGFAVLPAAEGGQRALRLLGVDPLSEGPFRPYLSALGQGERPAGAGSLGDFLTRRGAALLSADTAAELGVGPGDELAVTVAARPRILVVTGLLNPEDELSRRALADLAVVDVATAQELTGRFGVLSHVDLIAPRGIAPRGAGDAWVERVEAVLPEGVRLEAADASAETRRGMTRAFRLNLTALSLLALVCGLFLIYNSMTFSVVQRRTLLGTLRALGVTRRQVFRLVLTEAALVALVGTAAGLALGVVLGRGMIGLVGQTIDDLYFALSVTRLAVPPLALAKGALLGLGATLAAAALPAREATSVPPRAALSRAQLESGTRRALPRLVAAAVLLLAAGAALLAWPSAALPPAFAGLFALLVGCALLAPAATVGMMRLAAPAAGRLFGLFGRLAARGVVASLSRTGVAIAALAVAVSVTVGVGVMIDSFRGTVERWLTGALVADLYLSPADSAAGSAAWDSAPLDRALGRRLAAVPGAARVASVRRAEVGLPGEEPTRLAAVETSREHFDRLELVEGERETAWRAFDGGGAVIVSEPYAFHRGLGAGDTVELPTDRGRH